MAGPSQIKEAVQKGANWLMSRQNPNGSHGKWGQGSTGIATLALLRSGVPHSNPAVAKAVAYLLESPPRDSTYFRALTVMALIAAGDKHPATLGRARSDMEWLIRAQGSNPGNILSCGGWGHSNRLEVADGSNTQFALLALYAAARRGLTVPDETWSRALTWYKRIHAVNTNGSFVYSLGHLPRFDNNAVMYAITAGALSSTKIINLCSTDADVQSQAQTLQERALGWLNTNYIIELKPCVRDNWHFYYLFSLQTACVLEPYFSLIGRHQWRADMADYLITTQEPDGKWTSVLDKVSTNIIYSSFALISLSDKAVVDPAHVAGDGDKKKPDLQTSHAITTGEHYGDEPGNNTGTGAGEDTGIRGELAAGSLTAPEAKNDAAAGGQEKLIEGHLPESAMEKESGTDQYTGNIIEDDSFRDKAKDNVNDRYFHRLPAVILVVVGLTLLVLAILSYVQSKPGYKASSLAACESKPDVLACGEGSIIPVVSEIYCRVSGIVESIPLKPGSHVSTGQVLLNINPRDVQFELYQVEAEIEKCQVKIKNLSPLAALDIKSQNSGVVAMIKAKPGQAVRANTAVVTLTSSHIWDITLEEGGYEKYLLLKKGLPVDLYPAGGGTVNGVLLSSFTFELDSEGNPKLRAQVLCEKNDAGSNNILIGHKENGQLVMPGSKEAQIVLHTVSGPLETTCRAAKAELPVYPEYDGRLRKMYVSPGDSVAAGQPLGRISVDSALTNLQTEQIELDKLLVKQQYLMELLKDFEVVSPVSGQVTAILVEEGMAVMPGSVLAMIENQVRYRTEIPVDEGVGASVLPGCPAHVAIPVAGGRRFDARVDKVVRGDMNENGCFLKAVVVFSSNTRLAPGTPARVEIFTKEGPDADE